MPAEARDAGLSYAGFSYNPDTHLYPSAALPSSPQADAQLAEWFVVLSCVDIFTTCSCLHTSNYLQSAFTGGSYLTSNYLHTPIGGGGWRSMLAQRVRALAGRRRLVAAQSRATLPIPY
jgi:hypothetical protein